MRHQMTDEVTVNIYSKSPLIFICEKINLNRNLTDEIIGAGLQKLSTKKGNLKSNNVLW
jgi:hypothetical protein